MNVIGIIAEYNPFHLGHEYQIRKSREILGEDSAVIAIMSGDFVQRGDVAIYDKFTRAESAIVAGVDLVIELPLQYSLASAEGFSTGAVGILESLGVVTHLCFGSEDGNIENLNLIVDTILNIDFDEVIREKLKSGITYAKARQEALEEKLGDVASLIEKPNNILAVEYLKALKKLDSKIVPLTIMRHGANHDENSDGNIKSASQLRDIIRAGECYKNFVPEKTYEIYENREAMSIEKLEQGILARLRMLELTDFENLADNSEGLHNRLYKAVNEEATWDGILENAKTKRYTMARLRRMLMSACLGVNKEIVAKDIKYARILGMNERGKSVLREIKDKSKIEIINKPAKLSKMYADIADSFSLGAKAHDFYVLGYSKKYQKVCGNDWKTTPFIEKNSAF